MHNCFRNNSTMLVSQTTDFIRVKRLLNWALFHPLSSMERTEIQRQKQKLMFNQSEICLHFLSQPIRPPKFLHRKNYIHLHRQSQTLYLASGIFFRKSKSFVSEECILNSSLCININIPRTAPPGIDNGLDPSLHSLP